MQKNRQMSLDDYIDLGDFSFDSTITKRIMKASSNFQKIKKKTLIKNI
ncbi:MAG: hypothetical protein RR847_00890 [Bacilli bacterium]